MKLRILIYSVISLSPFYSIAQISDHLVRFEVVDSMSNESLEEATIIIKKINSISINAIMRTKELGRVTCTLKIGDYIVITSYLDYLTDTTCLIVDGSSRQYRLRIKLNRNGQTLDKIIVAGKRPALGFNHDTVTINSGAFPIRGEDNLEDFLQRLPGVTIDKDGNIIFRGKRVTRLMIDGKEILLRDIQMLTKNLPASMVASIQVFDTKTDELSMDNLFNSEKGSTLNVGIKESKRIGYTGNLFAGKGFEPNYAAGGSVIKLRDGNLLLAGITSNNINNTFEGKESWNGAVIPGRTYSHAGGLNFRRDLSKGVVISINGDISGSKTDLIQSSFRQTFSSDSAILQPMNSNSYGKKFRTDFITSIQYRIDSLTNISDRISGQWQSSNQSSLDSSQIFVEKSENTGKPITHIVGGGVNENKNCESTFDFTNYLNVMKRFHNSRGNMYLGFQYSIQETRQNGLLHNKLENLDSLSILNVSSMLNEVYKQKQFSHTYEAIFEFNQPITTTHSLSLKCLRSSKEFDANKNSEDSSTSSGRYDSLNLLTTNLFASVNTIDHLGLYLISKGNAFSYEIGLEARLSSMKVNDLSSDTLISYRYTNLLPQIKIWQKLAGGFTWGANYSLNSVLPGMDQLRPITDLSNSYLVRVGNLHLQQELDNHVDLQFSYLNSKTFNSWQFNTEIAISDHAISTATSILPGGIQKSQFVNVNGNYDFGAQIIHAIRLGSQLSNANIDVHSKWTHLTSIVNGSLGYNLTQSLGLLTKVNYHPLEKCFIYGDAAVDFTSNVYSVVSRQSTNSITQSFSVEASYEFPASLTLLMYYRLTHSSMLASFPSQQFSCLNVAVYKKIFWNKSGQIHLSIFDLLNTGSGIVQSSGLNYVVSTRSNTIGRFWLLSFVWNFHAFGK